jgi:hypothetical protein
MANYLDVKVLGSLLVFALILYAVMYFSKPAVTPVTPTPASAS